MLESCNIKPMEYLFFLGLALQPGHEYTEIFEEETHLSMATLECRPGKFSGTLQVMVIGLTTALFLQTNLQVTQFYSLLHQERMVISCKFDVTFIN